MYREVIFDVERKNELAMLLCVHPVPECVSCTAGQGAMCLARSTIDVEV
jgi:hypothetical protein